MSETLTKTPKTLENMCLALAKHMQYPDKIIAAYI
jgi:hypothetical protein